MRGLGSRMARARFCGIHAAVCGLLAPLLFAGSAAAQSQDERARALYVSGDEAYAAGNYELSVTFFEEAYALSHRPRLLFNIANALERMARWGEAAQRLEEYLPHAAAGDVGLLRSRIEALRARAERAEEQRRQATEARRPPDPQPAPVRPAPPPERPVRQEPGPPILGITLLVGGGLSLVAAGGFGIATVLLRDQAEGGCSTAADGTRLCNASAGADIQTADDLAVVTDILLVAGAGLGIAGAIALIIELSNQSGHDDTADARIQPLFGPGYAGVGVSGVF